MYEENISLRIRGSIPLTGTVDIRGSKNAASKMMVASLLTREKCTIRNIPFSLETAITRELCEGVGAKVYYQNDHECVVHAKEIKTSVVPPLSRRNRVSILAIGPLVLRTGSAEIPFPGGDPIGHRPINFHIEALHKMGIRFEIGEHTYLARAHTMKGADIVLPYPSVGATESILFAAVCAEGITTIKNAAIEPEIINVVDMLGTMGADIMVDQERRHMIIKGVTRLYGTEIQVIPDRNEVVSFACAALATHGQIRIHGGNTSHLSSFLAQVRQINGHVDIEEDSFLFWGRGQYRSAAIETAPHPGFMTDWQQPFCVVLTQAQGTSLVHETVYEDRLGYSKDLIKMGVDIETTDECLGVPCRLMHRGYLHSARIRGPSVLSGADLTITDIRAGIAHVIAALAAEGESVIHGVEHLDRGYEELDTRLRGLGADIARISSNGNEIKSS
ncbi:MAG: UDP-N-acetylglucosamine 1-carboxyvinyltransferase [Parcubacteria group bacterium Gr01-1014_66]|nr:MAG: UDP-N-acetylglucosamine 1-carboxyvinyltransferase [Parcubacteria group bacterium Gr01-1014_66]